MNKGVSQILYFSNILHLCFMNLPGKECIGGNLFVPWSNCVGWKNRHLQGMAGLANIMLSIFVLIYFLAADGVVWWCRIKNVWISSPGFRFSAGWRALAAQPSLRSVVCLAAVFDHFHSRVCQASWFWTIVCPLNLLQFHWLADLRWVFFIVETMHNVDKRRPMCSDCRNRSSEDGYEENWEGV